MLRNEGLTELVAKLFGSLAKEQMKKNEGMTKLVGSSAKEQNVEKQWPNNQLDKKLSQNIKRKCSLTKLVGSTAKDQNAGN